MDESTKIGRRERRRRKAKSKMEETEFEKKIENLESSIKPQVTQSLGKLVRRDTYTIIQTRSEFDLEGSGADNSDSRNLTYSLSKDSNNGTYNVIKSPGSDELRPVPAPRKRISAGLEPEKPSSDTDRDVTEIELDDLRLKSDTSSDKSVKDVPPPVPKPRKRIANLPKPESVESPNAKTGEKSADSELPVVASLREEATTTEDEGKRAKSKRQKKLLDLLGRKKKTKTQDSSFQKKDSLLLEKQRILKITTVSKEEEAEENKMAVGDEEKTDFQIESPHYTESAENGRIYVQNKNGFSIMEKNDIFRNENLETDGNDRKMEGSTVKTAILFQKFWARSMTWFHGVLAGFGFSHAGTVTAIMLHYNYEPQGFVGVYSSLSLKIHYAFYTLIALCIVSCFDRIDIGHMNKRHWETAWKVPSMWMILILYVITFVLTFSNQLTESRFDVFPDGNHTEVWSGQSQSEIQATLLRWYHTVWTRDVLVLFAWLMISLTKFEDFLYSHIKNMAKYMEIKECDHFPCKTEYF